MVDDERELIRLANRYKIETKIATWENIVRISSSGIGTSSIIFAANIFLVLFAFLSKSQHLDAGFFFSILLSFCLASSTTYRFGYGAVFLIAHNHVVAPKIAQDSILSQKLIGPVSGSLDLLVLFLITIMCYAMNFTNLGETLNHLSMFSRQPSDFLFEITGIRLLSLSIALFLFVSIIDFSWDIFYIAVLSKKISRNQFWRKVGFLTILKVLQFSFLITSIGFSVLLFLFVASYFSLINLFANASYVGWIVSCLGLFFCMTVAYFLGKYALELEKTSNEEEKPEFLVLTLRLQRRIYFAASKFSGWLALLCFYLIADNWNFLVEFLERQGFTGLQRGIFSIPTNEYLKSIFSNEALHAEGNSSLAQARSQYGNFLSAVASICFLTNVASFWNNRGFFFPNHQNDNGSGNGRLEGLR